MKRRYSLFVEDILDAIMWIEQFTKDMDFEQMKNPAAELRGILS
jgi:uncharacterized protein with HEPN domain